MKINITPQKITTALLVIFVMLLVFDSFHTANAQFYDGPGIVGGINEAEDVGGISDKNIRELVLDILRVVLSFMALAAVVVIVIAGIQLVVSGGNEEAKDKAKKIILYAVVGLLVIVIASAIVGIIASIDV